jgi:hypothetical protein
MAQLQANGVNVDATDVNDIKTALALQNVNNTSDVNKPVSAATQAALDQKATTASLGTAAFTAATAYATAVQGVKADNAAQIAGDLGGTPAAPTVPGLAGKQATLVSGNNIKTINGTPLLGSGDLTISSSGTVENVLTSTSTTNALSAAQGKALKDTADALATTVGGKVDATSVGANSGVAPLDSGGKVPAAYLPAYVDDVIEAANFAALPGTGETGKIYVTLNDNKTFRWGGSAYAEISPSPGSTDVVPEGSTNLYFSAARVRAAILTGLSVATNAAVEAADSILVGIGKLQAQITALISGKANTGAVGSTGITMSTARLLGRSTAGTGAVEEITISTGLNLSAGVLTAPGVGVGGGTKTLAFFTPMTSQPPATSFATLDTRNSIAVLDFDAASVESTTWVGIIPEGANLASGIAAYLHWKSTDQTSGNVRWRVEFERGNTDADSDSYDTATEGTSAANATSGISTVATITCTAIDGIVAGDQYRVRVSRVGNDATNDTMANDAELVAVELRGVA